MAKPLVNARHADEDDRQVVAVVFITEEFECGRGQSFGFIDDEQLDPLVGVT